MTRLVFGLVGTVMIALTVPAAAEVGVRLGENGVGVRIGDRDRGEYRDHDRDRVRYRDRDDWRWRRHHRDCDTVWHGDRRTTVCRSD
jgi:hypothetical protein